MRQPVCFNHSVIQRDAVSGDGVIFLLVLVSSPEIEQACTALSSLSRLVGAGFERSNASARGRDLRFLHVARG